jgi:hypothetical protein
MGEDPHFRRTARQPVELRVTFRRDADGAPLEQSGRLVDLGLGGAQVRCERTPPVGARLRLTLTSPSAWDPLDLPAEVRWVDDGARTFGLAFDALGRAEATALYELLSVTHFADADADAEPMEGGR